MVKRPAFSESNFLGHIFSPKKKPLPTGLRKTTLKGVTGRKASRLKSFNGMSAVNQEILKLSEKRDAYLRGETTLAEAKRELRPRAVSAGVAKPVRRRGTSSPVNTRVRTSLDILIANHIERTVRNAGKNPNRQTIAKQSEFLQPEKEMLDWDYGRIKYAGRDGSEYETFVDGHKHNPFWYH